MLESADLESYYDNFVEVGADSLKQLLDASDEELQEITELVGMSSKKLHVKRLQKKACHSCLPFLYTLLE